MVDGRGKLNLIIVIICHRWLGIYSYLIIPFPSSQPHLHFSWWKSGFEVDLDSCSNFHQTSAAFYANVSFLIKEKAFNICNLFSFSKSCNKCKSYACYSKNVYHNCLKCLAYKVILGLLQNKSEMCLFNFYA